MQAQCVCHDTCDKCTVALKYLSLYCAKHCAISLVQPHFFKSATVCGVSENTKLADDSLKHKPDENIV